MNRAERPTMRERLQVFAVVCFFLALVALPVLALALEGERARWQAAAAVNRLLHGQGAPTDPGDILDQLALLELNDDRMKYGIARVLLDHGHAEEALELAEAVSERPETQYVGNNLMVRSLNHLGRFDDSLTVYQAIAEQLKEFEQAQRNSSGWFNDLTGSADTVQQVRNQRLNGLAYHRALAGRDLPMAEDNIKQVMDGLSAQSWFPVRARISFKERTLIAMALIGRQVDRGEEALALLDQYLPRLESASEAQGAEMAATVNREMQVEFPLSPAVEKTIRQRAVAYRMGRERLATLLVARALVLDDLGEYARSSEDRYRVAMMGIEPQKVLQEFPDDIECLRTLEQAATYFDTRGVVMMKRGKHASANKDLDLALSAAVMLNQSFAGGIQNSVMNEGGRFFQESRSRELEASILYHRMQLAEEMANDEQAAADRSRIETLGFQPGPWLN